MVTRSSSVPARLWGRSLPSVGEGTIALGSGIALLVAAIQFMPRYPQLAAFSPDAVTRLPDVLAPLVVISLFLERAVEVIMTAWRAPQTRSLEASLAREMERHNAGAKNANPWAAQGRMAAYRAQSQRMAFFTSVVLALVVSMMGIRAIEMLVQAGTIQGFQDEGQRSLFVWVDIMVTALLLAGGADGIHKVIDAFTTFLDRTKQRVSGAPSMVASAAANAGDGEAEAAPAPPVP